MKISDAPSIDPADELLNKSAVVGHNKPTISEMFRETYAGLIAEIEVLAAKARPIRDDLAKGKVVDEALRDQVVEIGIKAGRLAGIVQTSRATEVEPLRADVAEWNALFGTEKPVDGSLAKICAGIKQFAERVVGEYDQAMRQKAAREAADAKRRMHLVPGHASVRGRLQPSRGPY